jgi:ATP-binding cassette subfamily B protein
MSDVARIGELFSWSLNGRRVEFSYLPGAVAVMLALDWKLALWVLAVRPLVSGIRAFFQKKLVFLQTGRCAIPISRITSFFNEGITGAKTI